MIEARAVRFCRMPHHDHRASDSRAAKWAETNTPPGDGPEVVPLSAARARATEEAAAAIARELNLPIRYIGVGEKIDDLRPFKAQDFVAALFDTDDK